MLKLKRVKETHLEKIMNWRMDKEVTKYMYTDPILDLESQKKWFNNMDDKKDLYWVIEYDSVEIGLISINKIDWINKRCAWGYYIANTRFRGKGIAKNLELNIYRYIFEELNLNKLVSEVFEFNEKVVSIHQKFGSEIEGILKDHILKNGEFYNVVVMGITKEKWENIKDTINYDKITFET